MNKMHVSLLKRVKIQNQEYFLSTLLKFAPSMGNQGTCLCIFKTSKVLSAILPLIVKHSMACIPNFGFLKSNKILMAGKT